MKSFFNLAVASVFIILVGISCKPKQQIVYYPNANTSVSSPTGSTAATTPATTTPEPATPEVTRNESFKLAEGEANTSALTYKYHVVVGSFRNYANAKGLQTSLNAEGNQVVIVVNEAGMYRVLLASYSDYAQARARINQMSNRFPDAWVLVQQR